MKLLFTGDLNWSSQVFSEAEAEKRLAEVIPVTEEADFVLPNLECPLGKKEMYTPIKKDGPNLICDEGNIAFLKALHTTAVTIGNNHIGDYGSEALENTLRVLDDNGILYAGAGKNTDEAYRAIHLEKDGLSASIISVCENEFGLSTDKAPGSAGYNPRILLKSIRREKECSDYVIVVFHGGNEENPLPSPDTKERYRLICDMGADAVIACHTHCPEGYEMYGEKPIVYSMGNFVFLSKGSVAENSPWLFGYLTLLDVTKSGLTITPVPYKFSADNGYVTVFDGEEKKKMLEYIGLLSEIILDDEKLKNYFMGWAWSHKWCAVLPWDSVDEQHYNIPFRYNCTKCEAHSSVARKILETLFCEKEEDAQLWAEKIEKLKKMPV